MKTPKPLYALACVLALAGALSGCATDQSGDGRMTDEKITADVQAMINQHTDLGPPNAVRVQTLDHVVYLSGQVSAGNMKQAAEAVALQSPGVTRVVNNIFVGHQPTDVEHLRPNLRTATASDRLVSEVIGRTPRGRTDTKSEQGLTIGGRATWLRVGGSGGTTPDNIAEMTVHALAFIEAIGLPQLDLLGFSLGGFIAQQIALEHPSLARRIILASSAPQGGDGLSRLPEVIAEATKISSNERRLYLFFDQTPTSQAAGKASSSVSGDAQSFPRLRFMRFADSQGAIPSLAMAKFSSSRSRPDWPRTRAPRRPQRR